MKLLQLTQFSFRLELKKIPKICNFSLWKSKIQLLTSSKRRSIYSLSHVKCHIVLYTIISPSFNDFCRSILFTEANLLISDVKIILLFYHHAFQSNANKIMHVVSIPLIPTPYVTIPPWTLHGTGWVLHRARPSIASLMWQHQICYCIWTLKSCFNACTDCNECK